MGLPPSLESSIKASYSKNESERLLKTFRCHLINDLYFILREEMLLLKEYKEIQNYGSRSLVQEMLDESSKNTQNGIKSKENEQDLVSTLSSTLTLSSSLISSYSKILVKNNYYEKRRGKKDSYCVKYL